MCRNGYEDRGPARQIPDRPPYFPGGTGGDFGGGAAAALAAALAASGDTRAAAFAVPSVCPARTWSTNKTRCLAVSGTCRRAAASGAGWTACFSATCVLRGAGGGICTLACGVPPARTWSLLPAPIHWAAVAEGAVWLGSAANPLAARPEAA